VLVLGLIFFRLEGIVMATRVKEAFFATVATMTFLAIPYIIIKMFVDLLFVKWKGCSLW
jgi:hypothetical protein